MNTTNTRTASHYDVELPIFSTGWHLGRDWSLSDLRAMARNSEILAGKVIPPISVGHSVLSGVSDTGQPALGHIAKLRVDGNRLLATVRQLDPHLKKLIAAGRFYRVSSEIVPAIERSTIAKNIGADAADAKGPCVVGLSVLGASRPECADLPSLAGLYANETTDETSVMRIDFSAEELSERPSLRERVAAAEVNMATLVRRTEAASRVLKSIPAAPLAFSSFTPAEAASASNLACLLADSAAAILQREGASPTDIAARRKAVNAVLREWATRAPSPHGPDAESMAHQLTVEDVQKVIAGTMAGEGGANYGPNVSKPAGRYAVKQTSAPPTTTKVNRAPTAYGFAEHADLAERLGSAERVERLASIARKRGVSLSRPADRRICEAILFAEVGNGTVAHAKSFDEAKHAALARLGYGGAKVAFAEPAIEREAVRLVYKERPDFLSEDYGATTPRVSRSDEQVKFAEAMNAEISRLDILDPDRRLTAARRAVANGTAPRRYGWRS